MFFGVWGQWRPGVSRREHFGHHFGRLCAPWGSFWRPLGSLSGPKVEKILKKLSPESPWAPRGAKRTLKAPQTLQNGTQKLEKITQK